jgi:hypothetical protein
MVAHSCIILHLIYKYSPAKLFMDDLCHTCKILLLFSHPINQKGLTMFEPETPESKLSPPDDGRCITSEREQLATQLLDDPTEWEAIEDAVIFDHELSALLSDGLQDLVEKRRMCPADSSAVRAAVNGVVNVFERGAMKLAVERIK